MHMNTLKGINKFSYMILLGMILLIGFANAEPSWGYVKQGNCINLTITTDASGCILSELKFPNSSAIVDNITMTDLGNGRFYYQTCNTSILGKYVGFGRCDTTPWDNDFEVTYSGEVLSTAGSFLYLGLLALLIMLLLFDIAGMSKLPSGNETNEFGEILSLNNLKYFKGTLFLIAWGLLIAIFFVASNIALAYLSADLLGNLLFKIYQIFMWLSIPFIILWIVWILLNIFKDKEIKNLLDRGIPVGGDI